MLYTHIFTIKKTITHDSYSILLCNWSCVNSWYLYALHISFAYNNTSVGLDSLPNGMTKPLFLESGPLLVMLGLNCSFLFTLITGHGHTKRDPEESHVFQTYYSLTSLWNGIIQFPLGTLPNTETVFFSYWFRSTRNTKWMDNSLRYQLNGIIFVPPGRNIPPLETKTSGPEIRKETFSVGH